MGCPSPMLQRGRSCSGLNAGRPSPTAMDAVRRISRLDDATRTSYSPGYTRQQWSLASHFRKAVSSRCSVTRRSSPGSNSILANPASHCTGHGGGTTPDVGAMYTWATSAPVRAPTFRNVNETSISRGWPLGWAQGTTRRDTAPLPGVPRETSASAGDPETSAGFSTPPSEVSAASVGASTHTSTPSPSYANSVYDSP